MVNYKINIDFNDNNVALDDIFTKVLLRELMLFLNCENSASKLNGLYLSKVDVDN